MSTMFDDNFLKSPDLLEDNDNFSPIKDYVKNKTVFITGGFGFVGKLLVEKLLSCDVKKIYLLVRAKKGKSLAERFEKFTAEPVSGCEVNVQEMFSPHEFFCFSQHQIFAKLLKLQKEPFSKIALVEGDLQKLDLGLSNDDQVSLENEIELVFHAAADVRFDESLREATEINIRGTREIMLLSQRMVNLNVFVYVSTAFCTPGFNVRETCKIFFASAVF